MKKVWLLFDEGHEVLRVYSSREAAEAEIPKLFGRRLTPEEIEDRGDGAPYEGGTPVIEEWDEEEAMEIYPFIFR